VGVLRGAPAVHPIDVLGAGIKAMAQSEWRNRAARARGQRGEALVRAAVHDARRIFAVAPVLAATIYRHVYHGDERAPSHPGLGWGASFAHMLGVTDARLGAFLERYGVVHCDQGKGNFSCHAAHLVGSTGADPFLCADAAIDALAGPAHARASQEVMELIDDVRAALGDAPALAEVEAFLLARAAHGRALPGYGQAVMKNQDTRFLELHEFGLRHGASSPHLEIAQLIWRAMPHVLAGLGKRISSRHPNVNLISGSLLDWLGVREREFYPVLFAVSRMLGVLCQFVEDLLWGLAPERPDSLTTQDFWALRQRAARADAR
jgi:citrate synthase